MRQRLQRSSVLQQYLQIRLLRNDKSRVIEYLETRIEECKIDRVYENRIALVGMRESIYQEVLDRVEGKK